MFPLEYLKVNVIFNLHIFPINNVHIAQNSNSLQDLGLLTEQLYFVSPCTLLPAWSHQTPPQGHLCFWTLSASSLPLWSALPAPSETVRYDSWTVVGRFQKTYSSQSTAGRTESTKCSHSLCSSCAFLMWNELGLTCNKDSGWLVQGKCTCKVRAVCLQKLQIPCADYWWLPVKHWPDHCSVCKDSAGRPSWCWSCPSGSTGPLGNQLLASQRQWISLNRLEEKRDRWKG